MNVEVISATCNNQSRLLSRMLQSVKERTQMPHGLTVAIVSDVTDDSEKVAISHGARIVGFSYARARQVGQEVFNTIYDSSI